MVSHRFPFQSAKLTAISDANGILGGSICLIDLASVSFDELLKFRLCLLFRHCRLCHDDYIDAVSK